MGLGPADGDLPGALPQVPARARHRRHRQPKVWVFCGDGEMDEPESPGRHRPGRARSLDNLIFVINCNLQRLDGPVRGNGKIIQELEGVFRGAGLERHQGAVGPQLGSAAGARQGRHPAQEDDGRPSTASTRPEGERRRLRAQSTSSAPTRTLEMVAKMSDEDIWRLNRGGHDPQGLRRLPGRGGTTRASPRCCWSRPSRAWGMGESGEGKNTAHQRRSCPTSIRAFRDRFNIPIPDGRDRRRSRSTSRPTTRRR